MIDYSKAHRLTAYAPFSLFKAWTLYFMGCHGGIVSMALVAPYIKPMAYVYYRTLSMPYGALVNSQWPIML
jgi:hypothetical protein